MRRKKTYNVSDLKDLINAKIRNEKTAPEARKALATILERVLFDTNNYGGFNYVDWLGGGLQRWLDDGQPDDNTKYLGDQSKVFYY